MADQTPPRSEIILYQTEDGRTRIQCRFENETIWLTQALIAELFQTTPQNVTLHLKAIYEEGEVVETATCKDYLQVRIEGGIVRKDDVSVAKNYLADEELQTLNRIVNAYLEFAELQAMGRRPMTMRDWIAKLDDFLTLSGRELLNHAGKISADDAREKAEAEYERYRKFIDSQPRAVDVDFERVIKKLPTPKRRKKPKQD
jgi:hypothetical protein